MRRLRVLLALLTTLIMLVSLAPAASAGEFDLNPNDLQKASVTIDGLKLDAEAYIVNDRTVVPLRAIFERLGATIEWDGTTQTVTATKGTKVIILTVGNSQAYIGGTPTTLALPPVLINSRTFVPLRFVSEALGAEVSWDQPTWTAQIKTNSGCALAPYQQHEGTIAKGGETWGRCGSPHVVSGTLYVEGADSPILTIEDGAIVHFTEGARIEVGAHQPGGLRVNGRAANPVVFTAATSGAQPGFWHGIRFFNQALQNDSVIQGARIEYAGRNEEGAIVVEGSGKPVGVKLVDVEISKSLFAGLSLREQGKLLPGSAGLKIHDTASYEGEGGFPIVTAAYGSNGLPRGEFKNNAVNAVNINEGNTANATVGTNTTWKNLSIPYAISQNINVEGTAAPTLTIEPGVITLWADNTTLNVGRWGPGHLVADATARPEGGGEWFTANWTVGAAELDLGAQLATAASIEPQCGLCANNRAIVFGAWNAAPGRGAWGGIRLSSQAGDKNKLSGVVIANGGKDENYEAGLYAEGTEGKLVKLTVSKSLITGAARSAMEFYENVQLTPESTGNRFESSGWPILVTPDTIGTLPSGQTFADNDKQAIIVSYTGSSSGDVKQSATWRNHGIPYQFDLMAYIGGTKSPVITIEAGTELIFTEGTGLKVGTSEGVGSLVAVGQAGKPIKLTSDLGRAGSWEGITFAKNAGKGNRLEYVTIEYATYALQLYADLGGFLKNSTIRSSSEAGIWREDVTGTSFTTGLGNQFEGNAVDQNEE